MLSCLKKGVSAGYAVNKICMVYGNDRIRVQTDRSWFRMFRVGNLNLEDEEHYGRPSSTNTDSVITTVVKDPNYSVREIADN